MSDISYPKSRVITCYALFGGAVGGLLVFLSFSINDGRLIIQSSDGEINFLFLFLCVGMILGFIPALIAGLCLSYWQVVIKEPIDYLKVFAFGAVATIIPLILYWIVIAILEKDSHFLDIEWLVIILFLTMVGGLSAVILAPFILPKSRENA